MALPSPFWLQDALNKLARVVPFVSTILAFFAWAYSIVEVLIVGVLNLIKNQIASLDLSMLGGANFAEWAWIGYVNALFPLSEAIGILGAYYTAWMSIIILRWIKSFVPTMAN